MIHGVELFFSLFNNLAIFLALVTVYGYLLDQCSKLIWFRRQTIVGLSFGIFAIGCMYAKIPVFEGVIVDQRNAIIALSGAFGGPLSAVVSAIITGMYRIHLGGDGVFAGLIGVCLAATAGILLHTFPRCFSSIQKSTTSAIFATIIILPGFLFVKDIQTGWELMKAMALPYGSAIFCGIFLVGLLLNREGERYAVEVSFRKSEEKYRELIEGTEDLITHTDKNGTFTFVNHVAEKIWGLTPEECIGRFAWQFAHGDDREETSEKINSCVVQKKKQLKLENRQVNTKTGETYTVLWSLSFHYNGSGSLSGFGGIARDITERKKAEIALQISEERLNLALSGSNEGIWDWDLEDDTLHFDSRYYSISGYEPNEFPAVFEEWEKRVHPDDIRQTVLSVRQYLSGELQEYDVEFRFQRKEGSYMWLHGKGKIVARNKQGDPTRFTGTHTDITERKQSAFALKESEEKARIFIENTPLPIALFDTNMCYMVASKRWLIDYNLADQDLIGRCHYEVFPEIGKNCKDDHQRVLKGEIYKNDNDKFIREDGSVQWLRYELHPWYRVDRSVGGLVMFTEDITTRKQTEEALQQNYMQLQAIYNTLPVIIWSLDEKGVFTLSEGKELSSLGLTPSQTIGMSAFELYKDSPFIVEKIQRGLKGESCEYDSEVAGAIYHSVLTPFFDKNNIVRGLNGLAINVTEKKRVEAEIRNLQNYLSNVIDSMPSQLIGVDGAGCITQWNKMVEKTTGIPVKDAKGKYISDLLPWMTFEKEQIVQSIQTRQVIQEQKKPFETKTGMLYKDVTIYPLIANGVEGAVIRIDDVTKEYELEVELNHSRKMDAIGQLAGGVAHDFNNMLSGILGAVQLLKLRQDVPDDKSLEYISIIEKASLRAADLTSKLLTFGRKGKIASTSIDIQLLIEDAVAILSRTVDKRISISIQKGAENTFIVGDSSVLQNSLLNLGINASHSMPKGGKIEIETKNIRLNQSFCEESTFEIEPGEYIQIEVRDSGCGIPHKNIQKIFEPFFTTKETGEGAGLGLAAVYGTVKDHHGLITVSSEVDTGTTFYLMLPSSKVHDHVSEQDTEIISGSGMVLLVDDEDIIRTTGKHLLEEMGYTTLLAENGQDAVNVFRQHYLQIDLVLMDMVMPVMDGRDAIPKLREIDRNCKIIIASGFTKGEKGNELERYDVQGFIKKPYRASDLSQLLAQVLNTS